MLDSMRGLTKVRLRHLTVDRAAQKRVLAYLKMFQGEIVSGRELQVVGAIQDVPRRIRELRVEFGYSISTGHSREDLQPNQYVLENALPDEEEALKWRTANGIRKSRSGTKTKWLELLKAYVEKPVTKEQLAYVASNKDLRRVRELRTQEGWRVVTRQGGRLDLQPGVYVLESLAQLPSHDRKIPDAIYDSVLVRDQQRCRHCGWTLGQSVSGMRKQFLEVHHVEHHADGGKNNSENLITLCNVDHDEVHRRQLRGGDVWGWLDSREEA